MRDIGNITYIMGIENFTSMRHIEHITSMRDIEHITSMRDIENITSMRDIFAGNGSRAFGPRVAFILSVLLLGWNFSQL
jgi:hypothetical protein